MPKMEYVSVEVEKTSQLLTRVAALIDRYDNAAKKLIEAYMDRGYGICDEVEELERVYRRES